jgi:hypothetical protein
MIDMKKVWYDGVNHRIQQQRINPGIWGEPGVLAKNAFQARGLVEELNEAQDEINARIAKGINMMVAAEAKKVKKKEIDHSSAWTALCIWEWLLTYEKEYPGYESYREGSGVMETRDRVLEMAIALDQVWPVFQDLTDDNYDGAFDFEFVPMFLKFCTNAGDKNQDFNRDGHELSVAFPDTEEGIKGAAKLLEKHWLEDGVW